MKDNKLWTVHATLVHMKFHVLKQYIRHHCEPPKTWQILGKLLLKRTIFCGERNTLIKELLLRHAFGK